jgi:hypothetical protein
MGGKLKEKLKLKNHRRLFLFVAKSCVFSRSFGVYRKLGVDNVIENFRKY